MTLHLLPYTTVVCAALVVGGCASHDANHDPTAGADNPANPNAPAAPPAFTMVRLAGPPGHATPSTAPASQPAGAYACPMHPEVTSNTPSTCPKCKMKLEPRKSTTTVPAATPAAPQRAGEHGDQEPSHGGHP